MFGKDDVTISLGVEFLGSNQNVARRYTDLSSLRNGRLNRTDLLLPLKCLKVV